MKRSILVMLCITGCFFMLVFASFVNAQSTVTLEWDPNPAAEQVTKYEVYQSQVSGVYDYDDPEASTIPGNETVTLPNIPDGTYFWVVKAENTRGWSLPSAEVTAELDSLGPPGPPENLIISAIEKMISAMEKDTESNKAMISALEDLKLYYVQQDNIKLKVE